MMIRHLDDMISIDQLITKLQWQRDQLESLVLPNGVRYDSDPVQSSPSDRMAEILAEVADIDVRIEQLKHQRMENEISTLEVITMLDDDKDRKVLTEYYVNKKSIKQISESMHYSVQHIYRIFRRASQKADNILREMNRKKNNGSGAC